MATSTILKGTVINTDEGAKGLVDAFEKLETQKRKPLKTFNYQWITEGDEIRKIFGNKKRKKKNEMKKNKK